MSEPNAGRPDLGNWRTWPYSQWAFHHVRELIPTAIVPTNPASAIPFIASDGADIDRIRFDSLSGEHFTVASALSPSHTDALLVVHDGRIAFEWYADHYDGNEPHLLFSVSKSVTGTLAGIVTGQGLLDPEAPVTRYVPELAGSVYGGCRVRHVLDMAVGIAFEESYLDAAGDYGRYRVATAWNPPVPGLPVMTTREFLATLRPDGTAHGQQFRYVSPNSDVLGWVLERATGTPFATLLSEQLWRPLGAEGDACVTVDHAGAARSAGGICALLRDLGRFGELMRNGGRAAGKRQVVPADWVGDTLNGGNDITDAWWITEVGPGCTPAVRPPRYRNQWYQTGNSGGAFFAVGIHGQWIYVDPAATLTMVRLSSQPRPVDDALDSLWLRGCDAVARTLRS